MKKILLALALIIALVLISCHKERGIEDVYADLGKNMEAIDSQTAVVKQWADSADIYRRTDWDRSRACINEAEWAKKKLDGLYVKHDLLGKEYDTYFKQ